MRDGRGRRGSQVGRIECDAAVCARVVGQHLDHDVVAPLVVLEERQPIDADKPVGAGGDHRDERHQGMGRVDLKRGAGRAGAGSESRGRTQNHRGGVAGGDDRVHFGGQCALCAFLGHVLDALRGQAAKLPESDVGIVRRSDQPRVMGRADPGIGVSRLAPSRVEHDLILRGRREQAVAGHGARGNRPCGNRNRRFHVGHSSQAPCRRDGSARRLSDG